MARRKLGDKNTRKSFAITGSGLEELKRFFSNKDFVWFDRKTLKDEDLLSEEDKKWLRSWTLSPLGVATIFYIAYRKLNDIATVYIGTWLYFEVHDDFILPHLINDAATDFEGKYPFGALITLFYLILIVLPLSLAGLYATYFVLRHGRRLSWNKGSWKSLHELKESEQKWFRYNFVPSLLFAGILLLVMF